ncbi:MAG: hypothetical protein KatS3mg126_2412 [Lysobacteraceae bacterium]|nr:MAG: hypothetical protein KatS3mg126_2412 [Xanthomonadaceae bacterium]
MRALKARIRGLGLPSAWFEPHWSRRLILARPGDRLPGPGDWRLVRLPEGGRPGLALQARPVTRAEWQDFVAATKHPASPCRVRGTVLSLRKRSWQAPGFAQQADHPVVCISRADAEAYARWLGGRQGWKLGLPTADELERHAAAAGTRCAADAPCRIEGTQPASAGPASRMGVRSSHGNVREWVSGGVAGLGWRDLAERRGTQREGSVDPARGYDDVGFRLQRTVAAAELETAVD